MNIDFLHWEMENGVPPVWKIWAVRHMVLGLVLDYPRILPVSPQNIRALQEK